MATPPAAAHEVVRLEVLEPEQGADLAPGKPIEIKVRAITDGEEAGSTSFLVKIDSKFLDPQTGRLANRAPSFGGEPISTGQTKTLTAQPLSPGKHALQITYRADLDEPPKITEQHFRITGKTRSRRLLSVTTLAMALATALYAYKRTRRPVLPERDQSQ